VRFVSSLLNRPSFAQWLVASIFGALFQPAAFAQTNPIARPVEFHFRGPRPSTYELEQPTNGMLRATGDRHWLKARPKQRRQSVELGDRIVVQADDPQKISTLLKGRPLQLSRVLPGHMFIFQAPDAITAAEEASRLAGSKEIHISQPIVRRPRKLHGPYAPRPNDPYFYRRDQPQSSWQAYLENRDDEGNRLGPDLNVRAAWPVAKGEGVVVAIGDDGVDLQHPDLAGQISSELQFNFNKGTSDGGPAGDFSYHGTAVAGLIVAKANNKIGITGIAPEARLASWVLFTQFDDLNLSDEQLMDVFQSRSNIVSVQNHSWGKVGEEQLEISALENAGISNAVTFGRAGRGVVLVRSAGNDRGNLSDANDDGYTADPRIIVVGAIRLDGRVARYSTPGACLLVAAPSGDFSPDANPCETNALNIVTTDRVGDVGYNRNASTDDSADYAFGSAGFSGTSAAAPQISGIVALILSANPNLHYRDVQQILILSARHFDFADPDLSINGAGFRVSHNVGFGVPDAGVAVKLARNWINRPAATNVIYTSTNSAAIPDLGLKLTVIGSNVPPELESLTILPSSGVHPKNNLGPFPLVDLGLGGNITNNLVGHAALIQRGERFFCEKSADAAAAGAALAIIYNNRDLTSRLVMGGMELTPIPAVFLSQNDGEALRNFASVNPGASVRIDLTNTNYAFDVRETLLCEWVGVRIKTDHTRRGDLRIVLRSPQGTESVLQHISPDDAAGPTDWTYYSTHHFYESSAGRWTIEITDEDEKGTGNVLEASLLISGVPIADTDGDGLDDSWEMRHFGSLARGPQEDPDGDGFSNAREQILGTDPSANQVPLQLDLSLWDENRARLSWPSSTDFTYQIRVGTNLTGSWKLLGEVPGQFPETEWFTPRTNLDRQFFTLESTPRQK